MRCSSRSSLVQLTVLFGGSRHVLETAGLTYAEYARQGFWQLLAVSALALVVLAFAARTARYETTARTGFSCARCSESCARSSMVVVVSAVHRMWTYEQAYGFTELRVFVTTVELWLGSIFVLVAIAGVRLRPTRWLPQAVLATGVIALLSLAVLNPDRFVAERNIDRYYETGRIDVGYLRHAVRRRRACPGPTGRADALVRTRAHRDPHRGDGLVERVQPRPKPVPRHPRERGPD